MSFMAFLEGKFKCPCELETNTYRLNLVNKIVVGVDIFVLTTFDFRNGKGFFEGRKRMLG